jgi:hypothetical protein
MVPIFEQGKGNGIGHSFETMIKRFIDLCNDHLKNGRARAFAFLLYDFDDKQIQNILKNNGGFTQLDRLSGKDLSIFYLHSSNKALIKQFNNVLLSAFEIDMEKTNFPLMLFFKIADNEVKDLEIVELEQSNLMFAFKELYDTIQNYIARINDKDAKNDKPKTNRLKEYWKSTKKIGVDRFIK